jgi:hypothetical protein
MSTIINHQEKQLRKQYHSLSRALGMSDDERRSMLYSNYQVESSVDLDAHQLIDIVHTLEKRLGNETDSWRKRAMASIGGWLKMSGKENPDPIENIRYIKQIACRATGAGTFNSIPMARLRNLYYEFKNKQHDKEAVGRIVDEELLKQVQIMQSFGMIGEA